jgi:hypothetical protein
MAIRKIIKGEKTIYKTLQKKELLSAFLVAK